MFGKQINVWYADRRLNNGDAPLGIWYANAIFTIVLIALCVVIEVENFHFDRFFPRRSERPGSRYMVPFELSPTRDEQQWRDWEVMVTQDNSWYYRSLSPSELLRMKSWINEASRWNRFVYLVKWGSLFQLGIAFSILLLGVVLLRALGKGNMDTFRWRVVWVEMLIAVIVPIEMLSRGYFWSRIDQWP
jgi:hypothetical protein